MELKRSEHNTTYDRGFTEKSSYSLCSSVEIKDAYIPPWVISSICAVLGSEERSFEARYGSKNFIFEIYILI